MSLKPARKKLKEALSPADEPLTRQDVILFQKEAIFRVLNTTRNEFNVLNEQYSSLKNDYMLVTMKLSNIIALIITLAKFVETVVVEPVDKEIVNKISEGDEEQIIQLSDSFMKILTQVVDKSTVSNGMAQLTKQLKNLQDEKLKLTFNNKRLVKELESLQTYYKKLIKTYERDDSLTVQRVFQKEDTDIKQEIKDDQSTNTINTATTTTENNLQPDALKSVSNDITTDTKEPEKDNFAIDKDIIQRYEDKITLLQNNIDSLNLITQDLKANKNINEDKLIKLETDILSTRNRNKEIIAEHDSLLNKIETLTNENHELSNINNDFLKKFQDLSKNKEIFTNKITNEFMTKLENLKKINNNLEKDLVRIRTARDDLLSKISLLESSKNKSELIEDIEEALKISNEQWANFQMDKSGSSQDVLIKEIQNMEKAFKEITELNNKKYPQLLNHESVISKLNIEKTKADQKYFAAMRSKDSILIENKNLSKTVNKSNEYILQLKDQEKLLQQKIKNLQNNISTSQLNEKRLIDLNKLEKNKIIELNGNLNRIKNLNITFKEDNDKYIQELNKLKILKNDQLMELKDMKLKLKQQEDINANLNERLNKLRQGDSTIEDESLTEELENFRTLVYCSLCSKNWKNMCIKTCGHAFCEDCCKERLAARMRKCPTCNNPFATTDLVNIHL